MQVMRGAKRKGTRYFGPYGHAWAIRETVDLLLRVFPVRTCSNGVFKRAGQIGRPCLLGYIGKCSAPCVGRVDAEEHRAARRGLLRLHGRADRSGSSSRIEQQMREAARRAWSTSGPPGCATTSAALRRALEKSAVVLADGTDADVFALAEDDLEAAVQVFHVRGGRVRGQRGWVVEKVEDVTHRRPGRAAPAPGLRRRAAGDGDPARGARAGRPAGRRPRSRPSSRGCAGARVAVRVPQRGDKKALLETVQRNAAQALTLHKTRRARRPDHRGRRRCRRSQDALGLDRRPAADRVLRRRPTSRAARRRVDGRLRGRPGPQERVPPLHRHGHARGRTTSPPSTRSSRAGSAATSRSSEDVAGARPLDAEARRGAGDPAGDAGTTARTLPDRPGDRAAAQVRLPAEPRRRRRRAAAGRRGRARARRARHRRRRRCAASPSGWRRSGCPARTTRWSCRAPARACTCCSGCATRRTGSPSPTTASGAARPMTDEPARRGARASGRRAQKALLRAFGSVKRLRTASVEEIASVQGIGPALAAAVVGALADADAGTRRRRGDR